MWLVIRSVHHDIFILVNYRRVDSSYQVGTELYNLFQECRLVEVKVSGQIGLAMRAFVTRFFLMCTHTHTHTHTHTLGIPSDGFR